MTQTEEKIIISYYTLYLVPSIIASVLNLAVFIVISRSDVLKKSKIMRQDLYLNLALANLVAFLVRSKAVFFPDFLFYEITCRFSMYISGVSTIVIQVSLNIGALSRYLNIVNPYHSMAGIVQKASGILIMVFAAILCIPYLLAHGLVSDEWTPVRCDILPETPAELFTAVAETVIVVPTLTYIILICVILRAIPEEDAVNDEVSTSRLGSRIVRTHFVVVLTLLAPLQILTFVYSKNALFTLNSIMSVLLLLSSVLDPVCFAILSPSFRREYKFQISEPGSSVDIEYPRNNAALPL